ncbi:hypothetical protein AB0K23_39195 [Streptomyces sp. NPDC049602]|uniref:hypothetical protein n=1 Tax=Streptomyces sp. NPDC049602 TaxID=3155504 RepID=UPI00341C947C
MTEDLQRLWDTPAGPVLDAPGHLGPPPAGADWPQVWWAPGGLLRLLPLHAAAYRADPAGGPHRRPIMDRVISSHASTVRAVRYVRRHTREHNQHPDTITQGDRRDAHRPRPPSHGRLYHVSSEGEMVRRHLPRPVLLRASCGPPHLHAGA